MNPPPASAPRRLDPRLYQIATLGLLLLYGVTRLEFQIVPSRIAVFLGVTLLVQWACTRRWRLPAFDPRSALISGLSLCLLMRTNSTAVAVLAAVITIASKFAIRWRGKHVFNPTNFGVVATLLLTRDAWVSPAQWGNAAWLAFLFACLGGLVVNRAARSDVTLAFLASWLVLLFGGSAWLGQPPAVPLHRLESGALLLFAFFMISDPKTTPDSRAGRVLFAALVALGAWVIQFQLHRTNGLLWSLAAWSMAVPLIDRLLPGRRYAWSAPDTGHRSKEVPHAVPAPVAGVPARTGAALGRA